MLKELMQLLPEDYGQLPNPNIPTFDPRYSKVIGQFDGYQIWGSREYVGYDTFGIRDEQGNVLSFCHVSSDPVYSNTHALKELWTHSQSRGKGLATILLVFLLRKIGIKLILLRDEYVSDDSRGMILKGLTVGKFKAFNRTGEQYTPKDINIIFQQLGKTEHEIVLSEDQMDFELFSDKKKGSLPSSWYLIRGTRIESQLD